MNQAKKLNYSNWLGISASGLCIVHCVLTPFIFTAKPMFYGMIGMPVHDHGIWQALDYIFLILSLAAVWYSSEHTNHATFKWALWASWVLFAIGLFFEPLHWSIGHGLMYAGSISLIIVHLKNYRHCQDCKVEALN